MEKIRVISIWVNLIKSEKFPPELFMSNAKSTAKFITLSNSRFLINISKFPKKNKGAQ
jgi:hypothetical protein